MFRITKAVRGTNKSPKLAPEDVISNMPQNVITNILDRLPIQDAVKTSILSKNWRFSWTTLTQLVFEQQFIEYLQKKKGNQDQQFYIRDLGRFLLHIKGIITKFVLYIPNEKNSKTHSDIAKEIYHWILFLSTKGMKEFVLINYMGHLSRVNLPSHFFSCTDLKHLELHNCALPHPLSEFHGFPNLLSVKFQSVSFYNCIYREFLTRCPLLEILKIDNSNGNAKCRKCHHDDEKEPMEIAKLESLKIIYVGMNTLASETITSSDFFQFMGCYPNLEELHMDFGWRCKFVAESGARKRFEVTLSHLKTLVLSPLDFNNEIMVLSVCELIHGSPNLQNLKITATDDDEDDESLVNTQEVDSYIMGHGLRNVELRCIFGTKMEVCFIKSLLANSSLLEKMVIKITSSRYMAGHEKNFEFAQKLLELHRASPFGEINLY